MKTTLVLAVMAAAAVAQSEPEERRYHEDVSARGGRRLERPEELSPHFWRQQAAARLQRKQQQRDWRGAARNVVMFLGDGMSVPTLAAARALTGEHTQLSFDTFPSVGLAKTYCVDAQVADSACSATAYLRGVKANTGTLGLTAAVGRHDCLASRDPRTHVASIAAWALADGRDAGIVTTTRVTHASPAGAYATAANRNWESDSNLHEAGVDPGMCPDIATQLIHHQPGKQFKVILGGGRREFRPNDTRGVEGNRGRRLDGRDLIAEWAESKLEIGASHEYVWNRTALLDAIENPPEYLLGLFANSHLDYALEAGDEQPSLAELTEAAIRVLARNPRGFFLFVEGGRIDHAHHDNYARLALSETLQLARAVQRARDLLPPTDTLLLVTADHAHVMTYNGYAPRGGDILGNTGRLGEDDLPIMTLSYTNGPGARPRTDYTQEPNFGAPLWRSPAEVPLASETHGGDDVAVFALGPHHDLFSGVYEQSDIPHLLGYAACLGPGPTVCSAAPALLSSASSLIALFLVAKLFL